MGFYALRLGWGRWKSCGVPSPAGVYLQIFIPLPLSHSLKPLSFKLERFLKGHHPLRSLDPKMPPALLPLVLSVLDG